MLKQRAITAIVMLAVWLPAVFIPEWHLFPALASALVAVAVWEWARLTGLSSSVCLLAGITSASTGCLLLYSGDAIPRLNLSGWISVSLAWVLVCYFVLRRNISGWLAIPRLFRMAAGILILALAWLALLTSYGWGANTLLSIMAIVWAADIGAYFAGKQWGKHKLAPTISPGKTWEGVLGGAVSVALVAALWLALDQHYGFQNPSIYSWVLNDFGLLGLALSLSILLALSICGDLFESLIKRAAGVKDSSHLLPGHGGVLDRIDALLPVMPVAVMIISVCQHIQGT
jgi:phosphatidate cytidylyltransferase